MPAALRNAACSLMYHELQFAVYTGQPQEIRAACWNVFAYCPSVAITAHLCLHTVSEQHRACYA